MVPEQQTVLMITGPGAVAFAQRAISAPGPRDLVIRPELSSFKHGTEMMAYNGRTPFAHRSLDPGLRIFENRPSDEAFYPITMGNMFAGVVEWAGPEADGFSPGARIFAWGPIADRHVLLADKAQLIGALSPEQAVCIDPASFALGAVLDGAIERGETVYVTGLGAIGLFVIQYCAARGADVIASSAFAARRELAAQYGARLVYDSSAEDDLARRIKEDTGGTDAAIECSGSLSSLHRSIRACKPCRRVVCVGFYGPGSPDLNLGEEFFHNRISLLASLPAYGVGNPVRTEPSLYAKDLQDRAISDFRSGIIDAAGLVAPIVPFENAIDAVGDIAMRPGAVVKAALRH